MNMHSTMTTGEDGSHRTDSIPSTIPQERSQDDEEVSVISTTCSSVDGEDNLSASQRHSRKEDDHLSASQRPARKTLWKDKNGAARYVAGDAPVKEDTNKPKNPREVVAAAAVTAAVTAGAIGGLVVLGPVGLAVGGLASAGSAASAFATQRRFAFQRRRQQMEEKLHQRQASLQPVQEPPCRRFTSVHEKEEQASTTTDAKEEPETPIQEEEEEKEVMPTAREGTMKPTGSIIELPQGLNPVEC